MLLDRFKLGLRIFSLLFVLDVTRFDGLFLLEACLQPIEDVSQLVLVVFDLLLRLGDLGLALLEVLIDFTKVGPEAIDLLGEELAPFLRILTALLVLLLALLVLLNELVVLRLRHFQGVICLVAILLKRGQLLFESPAFVLGRRFLQHFKPLLRHLPLVFDGLQLLQLDRDFLQVGLTFLERSLASRKTIADPHIVMDLI